MPRVDFILEEGHLSQEDVMHRMAKRGDTRATTFLERKHQRQVSAADRWNKQRQPEDTEVCIHSEFE
jgi:hypothetical protein